MARLVGIDIRSTYVRAALVRMAYRKVVLEQLVEVDIIAAGGLSNALKSACAPIAGHGEPIAIALEGERSFIHRVTLPATAARQIGEILPFELEAQLPIEFDDLVYDHRVLPRQGADGPLVAFCAAAREADVRELIGLVAEATGREPERVGVGPLSLANLAEVYEELRGEEPVALVELGAERSEVLVLEKGELMFARTLSSGTLALAQEGGAELIASELRQTLMAWLGQGGNPVNRVWLCGSAVAGAEQFLAYHLGIPVEPLPQPQLENITDDQRSQVPGYLKAIALALGLRGRAHDLDLRQGDLAFQRGFGFIKDRVPMLSGLAATIFVFFIFSAWAEMRTLERDNAALTAGLENLTEAVWGKATSDPDVVDNVLHKGPRQEDDPMPHMDAFDVIVEISKAVPHSVTHDIAEFDMQRGHVKLHGVVGSTDEAQNIAEKLKAHECFDDVKINKITQVVNSDRQKYILEWEVLCPEDPGYKKKNKKKKSEQAKEEK